MHIVLDLLIGHAPEIEQWQGVYYLLEIYGRQENTYTINTDLPDS